MTRRFAATLALGFGVVSFIAAPAEAAYGPAFDLSAAGSEAASAQIAVAPSGEAHFIWTLGNGTASLAQTRRRAADGTLGAVQNLSAGAVPSLGANVEPVQVAVDASGNAHFIWTHFDGTSYAAQTRRRDADGTLGPMQTLSSAGDDAHGFHNVQVAVDASGNAHFTWTHDDGARIVAQTRRRAADGTLGAVHDLAGEPEDSSFVAADVRVAVAPSGVSHFAWSRLVDASYTVIEYRRRIGDGALGSVQVLAGEPEHNDDSVQMAVDGSGNAHFTWRHDNDIVQTRRRDADGTLGPVRNLTAAGGQADSPQVAVDPSGNAHFAWTVSSGTNAAAQTVRHDIDGTLGPAQNLSAEGENGVFPRVAVDVSGNAHFTWTHVDGADFAIHARRRNVDGTLGVAQVLSAAGAGGSRVAVDANGNAAAVWMRADGTNAIVQGAVASESAIVFVHGFAGSKLFCGDEELWPHIGLLDRPRLVDLRLDVDGVSNLDDACAGPTSTRFPNGELVHEVLGFLGPIYRDTEAFLKRIAPASHTLYAWDWRKGPETAIAGLDLAVERARCGGVLPARASTCAAPLVEKVTLMAHSMGGLVSRLYIDDAARARKIERLLTVGTPYWGAPKAIFPLAAGIEAPGLSSLDPFLDNAEFTDFARNLSGNYFLYPSDAYGPWFRALDQGSDPLDRAALLEYVDNDLLGNGALLEHALDVHADQLDGFETHGVDYQVMAGSGLETISSVALQPFGLGAVRAVVGYENGDGTVPLRSAVQGDPGTPDRLGENVPIHYACGVSHVPLPGDPEVTDRIEGFLLRGEPILEGPQPCSAGGFEVEYLLHPEAARAGNAAIAASSLLAAGEGGNLEEAELAGAIQLLDFGAQKLVVTDKSVPVELRFSAPAFDVQVTPLSGGVKGIPQTFGPFSGEVTVSAGEQVTVTGTERFVNDIAFVSTRTGNGDVYAVAPGGGTPRRLTSHTAIDAEPAWSADGGRIAFTSTRGGNSEIHAMNADGSAVTRLTTNTALDASPAWSPDGTKIAFASNRAGGNWDIYVMSATGANATRLTTHAAADSVPTWSPNGTRIAFASARTGGGDLYTMNADGTVQTRRTTTSGVDTEPAWSGSMIAFSTNRHASGNFEIYTMNDDGSGQTRRTNQPGIDATPAWSPDGAKLVFATNRHGTLNFEIYAMNPDASGQTRLTTNPALDTLPDW